MNELNFRNKTFDLSQNSFVIFISSYAPGLIAGTIALVFINSILPFPDFLEKAFYIVLFIAMLIKAIMSLQLNKRTLILSDNAIEVYWKKRKNNILGFRAGIKNGKIGYLRVSLCSIHTAYKNAVNPHK